MLTSETPSAMLLPPRVIALTSRLAIGLPSIFQYTTLFSLINSTLCHAKPNEPGWVKPAWVLFASEPYSAVDNVC